MPRPSVYYGTWLTVSTSRRKVSNKYASMQLRYFADRRRNPVGYATNRKSRKYKYYRNLMTVHSRFEITNQSNTEKRLAQLFLRGHDVVRQSRINHNRFQVQAVLTVVFEDGSTINVSTPVVELASFRHDRKKLVKYFMRRLSETVLDFDGHVGQFSVIVSKGRMDEVGGSFYDTEYKVYLSVNYIVKKYAILK